MTGTVDVDVLVAGSGAAGLAAALAAAGRGLTVLLVEARPAFRQECNTAMSTAMIPAGGSRWQREQGVPDSPEVFLADVMRKTHGGADPVVARALTRLAPDLVAWLADDCGVELALVTDFNYPGHSHPRCHTVSDRSGRTLHAQLLRAAAERGVDLLVPARLRAVTPVRPDEPADGLRATLTRPAGEETVTARAVVLAGNGFGANPELVRRYLPEIADGLYHGGAGSTGDALRIGVDLGADTACLDAYQGHGSVAVGHGTLMTWAGVMHGGILVNTAGERFGDESAGYSEFARLVLAQPGGVAWMVFDQRVDLACRAFADYQHCRQAGAVVWAADAGELADRIGAPVATLTHTLTEVGELAAVDPADPATDRYGRTHWPAPLHPPYAAVRVTGALFHTQGGLRVDEHARVLRTGVPLPGLYAAGGAAVGMSGHGPAGYLAGNGLLAALGLGYLAGRHVGSAA